MKRRRAAVGRGAYGDSHIAEAQRRTRAPRAALLAGASGLALAFALAPHPALALDECGAGAPGGTVTCTPIGNTFPNGIEYKVNDLTVVVQDGVIVNTTGGAEPGGIVSGGGAYGNLTIKAGTASGAGVTITTDGDDAEGISIVTDGTATITSFADIATSGKNAQGIYAAATDGVSIASTGDITTKGNNAEGIYAYAAGGPVVVTSTGDIATGPGDSAEGIWAISKTDAVTVTSTGDVTTTGDGGEGIVARALSGNGDVTVTSTGNISGIGFDTIGIHAEADQGDVTVTSTGDISTLKSESYGIYGVSAGGSVTIVSTGDIDTAGSTGIWAEITGAGGTISVTSKGDITVGSIKSDGIYAFGGGGATIVSTGDITTTGDYGQGIFAASGGPVSITSTGTISTKGDKAEGISTYAATGAVTVTSTGNITTGPGDSAEGIWAVSKNDAVTVTSTGAIVTTGDGGEGIYAQALSGSGDVTITSKGDITTAGLDSRGIAGDSIDGDIIISSTGDISTQTGEAYGIWARTATGDLKVTSTGDITTAYSIGIFAESSGTASAVIVSTGDIATGGPEGDGIRVKLAGGTISVTSTGDIATQGNKAEGIYAYTSSAANVTVTSVGDISTGPGDSAEGIFATSAGGNVVIASTGNIRTTGDGISAFTTGTGTISITSVGDIASTGLDGRGIEAHGDQGKITIRSTGDISATRSDAYGIWADTGSGTINITATGSITTLTRGIWAETTDGNIQVYAQNARIVTTGIGAEGILVESAAGTPQVIVFAGDVSASGKDANAVAIENDGESFLAVRGDVSGGWGSAAGIDIEGNNSSQVQITDGVTVGALNDLAIVNGANNLKISSLGTITGYVDLGGGDDVLRNLSANSFNLRDFADTDGDGVRDTESVAIADFGAGTDDFDNVGTLRLGSADGATKWDTTGQIAHPGGGDADITQGGIEQGFLINLETFQHSGLITLQDGTAGDLLVITDQADGATKGDNVFTSNGGALALDVVLDDGSSGQSDVLILDKAVTGSGATRISIQGVDSPGGDTGTGDGILVVNVRTDSDADVFTLSGPAIAGAYQYDLYFQNQAKTDENWYLRSTFFSGAMEYPAIVSGALETWYSDLGALHERLGERRRATEDDQLAELPNTATDMADASAVGLTDSGPGSGGGGWFRVVGADMDIEQDAGADFDLNTTRAEAGFDVGFGDVLDDDWLVTGAFAGYGWSSVGFDSGADIDFDIATIGAYATYFRGPYYLDALVKLDWLDGSYNSAAVSTDGDLSLPVFGLSLQSGYRFDLTPNGFYLQPLAQLSFAHAGADSFKDDSGATIELEDADSLRGRLAARIGQELSTTAGARARPVTGNFYLEAAVNQEFLGETEAKVSGLTLEQVLPETTFDIGAGFDIALPNDGVSFIVDADYTFGEDADGITATGGLRITW